MNFDYLTKCSGHNLYSIPVVRMMVEMYKKYSEEYRTSASNPLADYYAKTKKDPVLRFVDYILLDETNPKRLTGYEDTSSVINYIVSKFYSLKGTEKVITSIESYLGIGVDRYNYDNLELTISLREADIAPWLSDEVLFNSYFIDFIEALLFVDHDKLEDGFDIGDEGVTLRIESEVSMSLDSALRVYKFKKIVL